jgi:hypothetical protein
MLKFLPDLPDSALFQFDNIPVLAVLNRNGTEYCILETTLQTKEIFNDKKLRLAPDKTGKSTRNGTELVDGAGKSNADAALEYPSAGYY